MSGPGGGSKPSAAAVLWLVWLLLATSARGADPATVDPPATGVPVGVISQIVFSGNRVTQERILRQEMIVQEGDPADPERIERSRQAIMDLGLFVSVHARLEPGETGLVLHIEVKEKYYILPLPKLNRDEDNHYSYGAELTVDNLAGLNQQLQVRYETEDATGLSGGQVKTYTLGYGYPRVQGTAYSFRTDITATDTPAELSENEVLTSVYHQDAWVASVQLSRWLNRTGPSVGWQVGGNVVWRRNNYDYVSGAQTDRFLDSQAVGISMHLEYIDVHDYLYSRSGVDVGYDGEYGAPVLGSDTLYTRHQFFYRKYLLIAGAEHQNLDMQVRLGLSSGDMFVGDAYAYTLGGSKTLRGYPTGTFTGNAFVVANLQYLRPLFGYNGFRGVVFADIGNTYPSNNELHLGDLHWDVGVGLRLRLRSFVKVDLRVDAAYAYDTGEWRYFAGTKEMF